MANRTEPTDYVVTMTETKDDPDWQYVRAQLRLANQAAAPHWMDPNNEEPAINLYLRDATGQIVGGVLSLIDWGSLQIQYLWVDERLRGQGFGSLLMRRAEAEGRARGCRWAALTTWDFQAPDFYRKLGYRVIGQCDDYPPGHRYYWMRRDF